jgi:hypothetical protein
MTTAKLRNSTGNSVKISGGKSVTRYKVLQELFGVYIVPGLIPKIKIL